KIEEDHRVLALQVLCSVVDEQRVHSGIQRVRRTGILYRTRDLEASRTCAKSSSLLQHNTCIDMDPLRALEVGARSGVPTGDVDDFVARMDMISEAMEQIKNGTFDPATCKIPGYKTPEQEEAERKERLKRDEERKHREEERKRTLKREERENWWMKAKLRFSMKDDDDNDTDTNDTNSNQRTVRAAEKAQFAASRALAAYKERDANDYSVWAKWEPRDPVTLEENAEREAQLKKAQSQEFEANNPEFCSQFKEDLEKRNKSQREKERAAEKCKQLGNACYKKKQYEQATQHYMQALDKTPFNVAVLTNLSQSCLRLEQLDDAVEFSTRALFIHPQHVKALSRRAAALHLQKQWKDAAADMEKAIGLEPENPDLIEQHSIVVGDYEDALAQSELDAALALKSPRNDGERASVEELRFVAELLKRMDEPVLPAGDGNQTPESGSERHAGHAAGNKSLVTPAWIAYELLLPFLERNESVRTLVRTSGELTKLCDRLAATTESEIFVDTLRDDTDQQLIVNAMINCAAAAMRSCPRNQVVMYRHARFRKRILSVLEDIGGGGDCKRLEAESAAGYTVAAVPWSTLASILRCVDEAVELKSWKRAVGSCRAALRALLELIQLSPSPPTISAHSSRRIASQVPTTTADLQSLQHTVLAASGICFTISGNDHGIREFRHDAARNVQAIAVGISHWQRLDAR
ncbi:hypothetical protein PybrP1_003001, partial [[Pythium] brassicae (nom. inval.)]